MVGKTRSTSSVVPYWVVKKKRKTHSTSCNIHASFSSIIVASLLCERMRVQSKPFEIVFRGSGGCASTGAQDQRAAQTAAQAQAAAAGEAARGERLVVDACVRVEPSGETSGQVQVSAYSVSFFAGDAGRSSTWCAHAFLFRLACFASQSSADSVAASATAAV